MNKSNIKGLIKLLNPELEDIVFQKQVSESPKNPYASFDFISGGRLGRPQKTSADSVDNPTTAITEVLETQRLLNVEIAYYTKTESDLLEDISSGLTVVNKTAREFADEFINKIESSVALDFMATNKFSILNYTDFSSVDDFLSDVWERRATIELQINYVGFVCSDIPFIGNTTDGSTPASITGNYINPDGSNL